MAMLSAVLMPSQALAQQELFTLDSQLPYLSRLTPL